MNEGEQVGGEVLEASFGGLVPQMEPQHVLAMALIKYGENVLLGKCSQDDVLTMAKWVRDTWRSNAKG